ncbi:LysR family transcriptional regulator [Pontibacterium sp. N1Y112]|uniref:LysR family transcriptional regulator n=1 Tax=Pontibacterium sinense TaxID=2781979 RepID=A0A8J7FFX2_9GAMM|nr:LysR family transcriptional regulator [Pontibacterium sinense]MBE9398949.1 LysR family transcriptional regulator [Pontibacterium sinense]
MNIKALRAFRLTLSEGSLAGASEKLHLSQPAVSRLISTLEGELKMKLFHRTGRRLKPTSEALAFYKEAGRILDNLDQIPRIAADIRSGKSESLRIVVMPRIAHALVAPVINQFLKTDGNVRVSVDVQSRQEAYKWVSGREYDFGIGALPIEDANIQTEVLLRARAQALIPNSHPLATKEEITADDLVDESIITLTPGLLLRRQVDDFFQSAGHNPSYACEISASMLACQLVEEGAGITIADSLSAAAVDKTKVTLRPLVPEKWMSFGLLLPKQHEQSDRIDRLIELLRERAQTLTANDQNIVAVNTDKVHIDTI